ncbi:hypothetical protein [Eubacterium coprostanoligenes]|mgnify:CR=1|uniref:Uncharacterized protein n=1 Tax=Eubacterium coprostanoligenes TaxID=290054 RepID=A0A1T4MPL5_9FIRM|nr:hypothetical protein [Eubacterium coprostanoligenes]MCI6253862.1 hypothetical protein [Eubacterium coprostanoligenes]MCI7264061.1 hypothetical protein [Eubacterium coprostanoligenes]MDD6666332.1 hypothetical protein [Eubacterium coprostanoligenes]MDY5376537.1 hypothetical protein [Eubacterium coprostanoligenes]SJZ68668.1 hypothetical protein SAMN02745114_01327 [Eubacterium coprostanoligenes]
MEDYNNQYYQPNQNPNPNQPPYQPQYQQPIYQQPYDPTTEVMSIGSYILMFILSAIPVVNIICWIVWLVSPNTNKNKKNFIWAQIIMVAVAYVAVIVALTTTSLGVNYLSDLMVALL